jgi:hypothetical protein
LTHGASGGEFHEQRLMVGQNARQGRSLPEVDKRGRFIAELRPQAKKRNLAFRGVQTAA